MTEYRVREMLLAMCKAVRQMERAYAVERMRKINEKRKKEGKSK